jgi:hypothetical protein
MSTMALPGAKAQDTRRARAWRWARQEGFPRLRYKATALWDGLTEQIYTIPALGCFVAAMFVWDIIPGLLAASVSLFALELKTRGA